MARAGLCLTHGCGTTAAHGGRCRDPVGEDERLLDLLGTSFDEGGACPGGEAFKFFPAGGDPGCGAHTRFDLIAVGGQLGATVGWLGPSDGRGLT